MTIIDTVRLTEPQRQTVLELWNQEYPAKLKLNDLAALDQYLSELADGRHYLVTDESDKIFGWAFTFVRAAEKWFAIIIDTSRQGLGCGRSLLSKLKEQETKLSGWVIDHADDIKENGEPYQSPLDFYLKNGFSVVPATRLESEKISAVKVEWQR